MEFKVYVDREGTTWPPSDRAPGDPITVDVHPDTRFGDGVGAALRAAGRDVEALYYVEGRGPYYQPRSLRDSAEPNSVLVAFPRVVITSDGQLLWTWGARDSATFADFERAREAGYFDGDPYGVFLERPMYGNGVIPGWEELFKWLAQGTVGAVGAAVLGLLRRHYRRWLQRGATTPYAFLDVVLARKSWRPSDLSHLLGLSADETTDLLHSFGFHAGEGDPEHWQVSDDPNASEVRRKILHDFMHHPPEEDESGV